VDFLLSLLFPPPPPSTLSINFLSAGFIFVFFFPCVHYELDFPLKVGFNSPLLYFNYFFLSSMEDDLSPSSCTFNPPPFRSPLNRPSSPLTSQVAPPPPFDPCRPPQHSPEENLLEDIVDLSISLLLAVLLAINVHYWPYCSAPLAPHEVRLVFPSDLTSPPVPKDSIFP